MTVTDLRSRQTSTELLDKAGNNIILNAETAGIVIMAIVFLFGIIGKLPL